MNLSEHFYILHISRQATRLIPKNRRKKATKNSILVIFSQRSIHSKIDKKKHFHVRGQVRGTVPSLITPDMTSDSHTKKIVEKGTFGISETIKTSKIAFFTRFVMYF
jgi:hypothetical protein